MNLSKITVALFSVFLVSCSNESDLELVGTNSAINSVPTKAITNLDFTVENGIVSFNSMEAYDRVIEMLTNKSEKDLLTWSNNNGYNSLLKSYQNVDIRIVKVEGIDEEINDPVPFRMSNLPSASLFNENGVMVIRDTIYKVINDYVYIIANNDFETMRELEDSPSSYETLPVISRYKHTQPLELELSTKSVSDGDRSFVIEVSKKRREYANFEVNLSTGAGGVLYLDVALVGRAQKKAIWWGRDFDDEFEWAQFTCLGGSFNDRVFFDGFTSPRITGTVKTNASQRLGISSAIDFVKTTVEFSFTKNSKEPNEFYSNKYFRDNK